MFQSTHSRGVRLTDLQDAYFHASFNPRTHEECDKTLKNIWLVCSCFNPRTHEECDNRGIQHRTARRVSIHALTRSATNGIAYLGVAVKVSIHALTRSATIYNKFVY